MALLQSPPFCCAPFSQLTAFWEQLYHGPLFPKGEVEAASAAMTSAGGSMEKAEFLALLQSLENVLCKGARRELAAEFNSNQRLRESATNNERRANGPCESFDVASASVTFLDTDSF